MQLNRNALSDNTGWNAIQIKLPEYDVRAMANRTIDQPIWLHFGAGNIFRAYIAALQQKLLNQGLADRGIVAAETFDYEIIDKIYAPHDNLTLSVTLKADGSTQREIIASVAEGIGLRPGGNEMERLAQIFANPSLQMASFTITEKGYAIAGADGSIMPIVQTDMANGPENARHTMSIVTALLHKRYLAGGAPIAMVSMDNVSHNGEKLANSVHAIAQAWQQNGFVAPEFLDYLKDENKVSFPWSMIDKITPRPSELVEDMLAKDGVEAMAPIVTAGNTYIAPFVNAEAPEYLVIEDAFPNGRPALEKAGVYLTDRDTVNQTERMKVTTCLNPLHTALAVYGCLLGYSLISAEMKDADLVALVNRLGYVEGLPVVTDPKILSPRTFLDEVITQRLPNPFMPDAPQRIATDTSQKVGIRFGETIKSYVEQSRDTDELIAIPLAIAGWLRYLLALNDNGQPMELSSDPLLGELQQLLSAIKFGNPQTVGENLQPILSNASIFGIDLYRAQLGARIEEMFKELIAGPGAVRATLQKYLG